MVDSEKRRTAILLFSHTAVKEAKIKTFLFKGGSKANSSIVQNLINHNESVAKKTGVSFFSCYSEEQSGKNFGERLANAIESVFSKGYDKVIAIGNDCPSITSSLLLDTINRIDKKELVIGPAKDGGVYLIGINRTAYCRSKFIALPWKTPYLQQAYDKYAGKLFLSIEWLESLCDIDNASDLKIFIRNISKDTLLIAKILQNILASYETVQYFQKYNFGIQLFTSNRLLRAPPF